MPWSKPGLTWSLFRCLKHVGAEVVFLVTHAILRGFGDLLETYAMFDSAARQAINNDVGLKTVLENCKAKWLDCESSTGTSSG